MSVLPKAGCAVNPRGRGCLSMGSSYIPCSKVEKLQKIFGVLIFTFFMNLVRLGYVPVSLIFPGKFYCFIGIVVLLGNLLSLLLLFLM